jgi:rhodanese-related sulfurtransferase
MWRDGREVALLDAREEDPFSQAHPFFAVCVPLSQLELKMFNLVPRRSVPIVVYDAGEGLAAEAAGRMVTLGYRNVSLLDGGLAAYRGVGEVFRDVNVPSKAFGELVEAVNHTPMLAASDVKRLVDDKADVVVLDVRPYEEYHTMNIPSGVNLPGADLSLGVYDLVRSPNTLIVVNCAGRTRSIVGTQTLVNLGLPNRVAALRNGTIGWSLAGFDLEQGQSRRAPLATPSGRETARAAAEGWTKRVGVRTISRATLSSWIAESEKRTLYRLDVRSPDEFEAGHPSGFVSAPGGQLVQATDQWIAVRGARIVLFDTDGVRARMTASWLMQMGWDAGVIEADLTLDEKGPVRPSRPNLPNVDAISWSAEQVASAADAAIVDLATSAAYQRGHIPGASFVIRSRFSQDVPSLPGRGPIVLTSPDGALAAFAAADAAAVSPRPVHVLSGGTAAWIKAGLKLVREDPRWVSPAVDLYKRPYEGTDNPSEAMQRYIEWELQLVAQLANDGVSRFHVARKD